MNDVAALLAEVRACRACGDLPSSGPRPLLQLSRNARILIASKAPGRKAHTSDIPFSDPLGDRLREWMRISAGRFYDPVNIDIFPLGLCYPGRARSGDAPPRPECARLWRVRLLAAMPELRLRLLLERYAQNHVLGPGALTERVRDFGDYLPRYFPLPNPSWRGTVWSRKYPWFEEEEVLPALRAAAQMALNDCYSATSCRSACGWGWGIVRRAATRACPLSWPRRSKRSNDRDGITPGNDSASCSGERCGAGS
ncbi:MAG: uracil-DNA glycosylase family protein [Sphingomonadales bacterium]